MVKGWRLRNLDSSIVGKKGKELFIVNLERSSWAYHKPTEQQEEPSDENNDPVNFMDLL